MIIDVEEDDPDKVAILKENFDSANSFIGEGMAVGGVLGAMLC